MEEEEEDGVMADFKFTVNMCRRKPSEVSCSHPHTE